MKKRITFITLVMTILLGLVGCGDKEDKTTEKVTTEEVALETYEIDGVTFYGDPYEDLDIEKCVLIKSETYESDSDIVKYEEWKNDTTKVVTEITWYRDGGVSYSSTTPQ